MSRRASTSTGDRLSATASSYDGVAAAYAEVVRGAVTAHPYLRAALGLFAEAVAAAGGGLVADIGCGPGHVSAALHELGLDTVGIDLSPMMVEIARHDHPDLRFDVGSMTDLDLPAASVSGLLARQSIIHVPDGALPGVLAHFHRVLRPGGVRQLLFHVGDTPQRPPPGLPVRDPSTGSGAHTEVLLSNAERAPRRRSGPVRNAAGPCATRCRR